MSYCPSFLCLTKSPPMRCTSPLRLACEITGANSQLNRNPQSPREPTWVPGEKRIQFWRPLHHSFFQSVNSLSLGAWYCLRLGIPEKWVHFSEPKVPLICTTKKEMVTHSNNLFWEISWTEEPGGYSMASQRVGDDLATQQQQEINNAAFLSFGFVILHLIK